MERSGSMTINLANDAGIASGDQLKNLPPRRQRTMSSISIGIVRARTTLERVVIIEDVGKAILRWGLVLVLAWIGAMKFTAYEAMGIQPLVSHSPLLTWMYRSLSVRSFSTTARSTQI